MNKLSLKLLTILAIAAHLAFAQSKQKTMAKPQVSPNYQVVFPDNKVNTLEIQLGKAVWDSIQVDMKKKYGNEFGKRPNFPGMRPPNMRGDSMRRDFQGPPMGGPPMGGGPMKMGMGDPNYFKVAVKFNGQTIKQVAFRLKGNSSLTMAWGQGIYKLPFRLSFDKYVKKPTKGNAGHLYGFHELTFSPGFSDNSLIREKICADLFRLAGVPAARTSFCKVYINFNGELKYCGVYTLVEVIDDTMVKTQFGDETGNIYKPESTLERFTEKSFEKKNNKKLNDFSDVKAFVAALNDTIRESNPALWRANLEKTFDINHFLKYLAVNNVMVNWDTYGAMPHNYYLYNSPTQKLTWIPWDNNMAMSTGGMFGGMRPPGDFPPPPMMQVPPQGSAPNAGFGPPPMGGLGRSVSLSLKDVNKRWPLLKYVKEDPVYFAKYRQYVAEFTQNVFQPDKMDVLLTKYHKLIAPFVSGIQYESKPYSYLESIDDFDKDLEALKTYIRKRNTEVEKFLKEPPPKSATPTE